MKALILADIAPLYTQPNAACELADEAFYGMEVTVLDAPNKDFVHVRTAYAYEGYVPAACLLQDEARVQAWAALPKKVVMRPYVDALDAPKVQGYALAHLPRGGSIAPVGAAQGGWQEVELVGGERGHIMAGHLREMQTPWQQRPEADVRAAIVRNALLYLGCQYRWGGKTALGIDCSGLSAVAYMLEGIYIYRDADIRDGFPLKKIERSALQCGDLLFFPGHVAVYLGDGKYIHATARAGDDGVVVNSLNPDDPDYRKDLDEKMTMAGGLWGA